MLRYDVLASGAVNPGWRRVRLAMTLVMAGVGALLLWAAYAISGTVTGAAISWMVLVGLLLPSGFFGLLTVVGWQHSAAPPPNALIAWGADTRHYPLLWAGFVAVLLGSAQQLTSEIQRGDAEQAASDAYSKTVADSLGAACYANWRDVTAGVAATDVAPELRVPHFCTCLDIEVEKSYTPVQFAAVPKEHWWRAGDATIDRIMRKCRLYDSSVVRAVRTIRNTGGDLGNPGLNPKILNYAACVDVEVRADYEAAEMAKVPLDPAAQDADAKFAPIVAKCLKYARL